MAARVTRGEKDKRRHQQPADGRDQENVIPGEMGQHVQRQIGRADCQPLRQLNELGKDNSPAAGDGTDRTRQGNEREGLDLIELLAEALASTFCGNLRNECLSLAVISY